MEDNAITSVPATDDKGRQNPSLMSDRELLEEIVGGMRFVQDMTEKFIADFAKNPMFGTLTRMFGGR